MSLPFRLCLSVCLCPCLSAFLFFTYFFFFFTDAAFARAGSGGRPAPFLSDVGCRALPALPRPCPPPPLPSPAPVSHGALPSHLPFQTRFPLFCAFVGHHRWVLQSSGAHLGVIMGFCTLTQAPASERKRAGKKGSLGRGASGQEWGGGECVG